MSNVEQGCELCGGEESSFGICNHAQWMRNTSDSHGPWIPDCWHPAETLHIVEEIEV